MPSEFRATVKFPTPVCPIAELSGEEATTIDSVSTTVCPDGTGHVVEFAMQTDSDPGADVTPTGSDGTSDRYRLDSDGTTDCPCACLGVVGCPIERYAARNGTLTLTFEAADYDQLKRAIAVLRDRFPDTDIERLVREPTER